MDTAARSWTRRASRRDMNRGPRAPGHANGGSSHLAPAVGLERQARERPFRVLFPSTTVSGLGDGVARVALAFAVLEITDSASALGAVIAARQLANAVAVLAGGVWADRLRRERVLVGAAIGQGAVQAA